MFTYNAADGQTTLHGLIHFPSTFDPTKKYPALANVYGGPASAATSERFTLPSAVAEYGFLVLTLDSRAAPGMGKRMLDQIYLKLGQVEIDDMAEGVKALWNRPYFDKNRVGIFGGVVRRLQRGHGTSASPGRLRRGRPPRRRPPTGATTTRSTPSATCGRRRRTRTATTRARR